LYQIIVFLSIKQALNAQRPRRAVSSGFLVQLEARAGSEWKGVLSGGAGRRLGGLEAGHDCGAVVPRRNHEAGAGVSGDQLADRALAREPREALGGGAETEGGRPTLGLVVVDAGEQGAEHVLTRAADGRLARVGGHHHPMTGAAEAALVVGGAGGARGRGGHRTADDGRPDAADQGASCRTADGHDGGSPRGSGGRGRSELRLRRTHPRLELRDQRADLRSPARERGRGGSAHPRVDQRDRALRPGLRPGIRRGDQEQETEKTETEHLANHG
jgi:hypothetical protein